MIYVENETEQERFTAFVEYSLGVLAKEDYTSFISLFDSSRMTEQELISALRYLDESRPVMKIDDPALTKSKFQQINLSPFSDGSGYHMDYDLTTNGTINDLTVQVDFFKEKDGYHVVLDDLHTL